MEELGGFGCAVFGAVPPMVPSSASLSADGVSRRVSLWPLFFALSWVFGEVGADVVIVVVAVVAVVVVEIEAGVGVTL